MPGRTKPQEPPAHDVSMEDAPTSAQPQEPLEENEVEDGEEEAGEEEEEEEPQRVRIVSRPVFASTLKRAKLMLVQLPGSTDSAASFEFTDEGHTLGNALRYIIMKK